MQKAPPHELKANADPVLMAAIVPETVSRMFPGVEFQPMDSLSEPEPSIGALIRLDNGEMVVVVFGTETHTLSISVPGQQDAAQTLSALTREVPIDADSIVWLRPDIDREVVDRAGSIPAAAAITR